VRPVSARAHDLLAGLRRDLARDLPLQLDLQRVSGELPLSAALEEAVLEGLPPPAPFEDEELAQAVGSFAFGTRPFESVVAAVTEQMRRAGAKVDALPPALAAVVRVRVRERRTWAEAAEAAELSTAAAAMRAL